MNRPWLKFYPCDWRGDPRLRMCSFAARGLWIDLMSYMHEGQPYGHLTIDGIAPDISGIAALTGRPEAETKKALAELEVRKVFSRTPEGTIYSRRMVRDAEKAARDKANGSAGGNPALNPGVNPPNKAHIPEPRNQRSERKKENGKSSEVKGWTPPKHGATSTKSGRVYIKIGTSEWDAYAADYRLVHHQDPVPNPHGGKWFKILGEQELGAQRN